MFLSILRDMMTYQPAYKKPIAVNQGVLWNNKSFALD